MLLLADYTASVKNALQKEVRFFLISYILFCYNAIRGDKMINTAVCDDEHEFLKTMSQTLKQLYPDEVSIDTYTFPTELLKENRQFDIIFLDIDMPDMDGFELSKHYKDTPVVFVTSHEALVFKAYNNTDSFGFIRKSRLSEDLKSVMKRFFEFLSMQKNINVKINGRLISIKCKDIFYIEKQINHIIIHTQSDSYTVRKTLSEIETLNIGFIRTHIGYLVNPDTIQIIEKNGVILKNGMSVPVSRSQYKHVCEEFMKRSVLSDD